MRRPAEVGKLGAADGRTGRYYRDPCKAGENRNRTSVCAVTGVGVAHGYSWLLGRMCAAATNVRPVARQALKAR